MSKTELLVVAGCNGSGKSTYSRALTPDGLSPFDYDKHFLDIYNSKPDSELRERMSHNRAFEILEQSVENAINHKIGFCYETNFNSTPMHWPQLFRSQDYEINMIYFCLDSVVEAKRRVQIRYENGGHYVPDYEVEERFYLGYQNLNNHFTEFDHLDLFDSNTYDAAPRHILSLSDGCIETISQFPQYLNGLIPAIGRLIPGKK